MKHLFSCLAALAISFAGAAQTTSGTVHYKETISFEMPKLEGEAAQFAAMMPKEQKLEHVLYFNPEATMFQPVAKKESDAPPEKTQGIVIKMDAPQEKFYTNVKDGQSIAQREFFGRKFLVTGAPQKQSWKMTGKQKTILNYPCQEAIQYREKDTIIAWFTTAIPVSSGPRDLCGLPGLILATQTGRHSNIVATSIDPTVPVGAIVAPKGGKKVTNAQYNEIVEAKMAEMGAGTGPGGERVMIKVRHN
jgi:GLPGLI family protein